MLALSSCGNLQQMSISLINLVVRPKSVLPRILTGRVIRSEILLPNFPWMSGVESAESRRSCYCSERQFCPQSSH
jgi:hypothetical protein